MCVCIDGISYVLGTRGLLGLTIPDVLLGDYNDASLIHVVMSWPGHNIVVSSSMLLLSHEAMAANGKTTSSRSSGTKRTIPIERWVLHHFVVVS